MEKFGPCVHYWCMRFESHHHSVKTFAQAISCSKDLLHSIGIKQILRFCQYIHDSTFKTNNVVLGARLDETDCYKSVKVNGVLYEVGTKLFTDISTSEKIFGGVTKIKIVNNEILFSMKMCEEISSSGHHYAFVVEEIHELENNVYF